MLPLSIYGADADWAARAHGYMWVAGSRPGPRPTELAALITDLLKPTRLPWPAPPCLVTPACSRHGAPARRRQQRLRLAYPIFHLQGIAVLPVLLRMLGSDCSRALALHSTPTLSHHLPLPWPRSLTGSRQAWRG